MTPTVSRYKELISRFRHHRSANPAMALSVNPNAFWKQLALKAIDGGYFKSADEFVLFVEACLRYLGFEQVVQDRPYARVVLDLAEALARKWACGTAPDNAPTAGEIAGLLQSEWVRSGEFRGVRSASPRCDSASKEVVHGC